MSLTELVSKAFNISSFTTVGHLLHVNLKDHLLPHKHEIGQALLAKNNRALAVVNKVNTIDNEYRNFEIEIIARREGCQLTDEELMICEVNENKCRFKLDFSKVYWNSRLSTEHERILAKFNKGIDVVFDLFAGVGPFSVPAAKAKCITYANDLNPESVKWLKINMQRNKVQPELYKIHNMDAKDFILKQMKESLFEEYKRVVDEELATKPKIHILMNLPALAPTFLPTFVGLFNNIDDECLLDREMFNVLGLEHIAYCYCFLKGSYEDPKAQVKIMIEENLGRKLTHHQLIDISRIRNVAPSKEMYRAEIRLDEDILFDTKVPVSIMRNTHITSSNGTPKRVSIDESIKKRSRDDSPDNSINETNSKRFKVSEYCSIM